MTAIASDTDADFLRAILAVPDDDAPRLIYADWLDENGQPERAEFIRVQCRIAEIEHRRTELFNDDVDWIACTVGSASWCPNCGDCCCPKREESMCDPSCPLHSPASNHDVLSELGRENKTLNNRSRAILQQHGQRWVFDELLWPIKFCRKCGVRAAGNRSKYCGDGSDKDNAHNWSGIGKAVDEIPHDWWERGFIAKVEIDTATLLGRECERCRGDLHNIGCPGCGGSGRVGGCAEALARAVPLRQCVLTDLEFFENDDGRWACYDGLLPEELQRANEWQPTEQAARENMATATAAFVRRGGRT